MFTPNQMKRKLILYISIVVFSLAGSAFSQELTQARLKMLFSGLDPASVSQHLAFYDLYPNTQEGQQALSEALRLLSGGRIIPSTYAPISPSLFASVQAIVGLVNKHPGESTLELTDAQLGQINALAAYLPNRSLAGYRAVTEAEVMRLPPHQIDLARGVLLSQLGESPDSLRKIRSYEASIDLMALQILTRVNINDPPQKKIRAINHFIFEEMGFRFPPHSSYAKDVDLYTFLPSVLDSRKGVCLGVSILYICLAQRLNLNLEIITPPGHIFVRWHNDKEEINIETTARGINLPSEEYLGVDTRALQHRNLKETIGMAHINQASVYWERQNYEKTLQSYIKAVPYLPGDKQLLSLMGIIYLLKNDEQNAKPILEQVTDYLPDDSVSKETLAEDYFNGLVGADGVHPVFMRVDETRESLIKKREALEESLRIYPRFREGLFSLAGTWLQLHRAGEALEVLKRYHDIDPNNASVEYYLAALYAERLDYNKSWKHLRQAEYLVKQRNHEPKVLLELRQQLAELCPE